MMQGAGESQDGWGTPIFNMDAQKWTPSGKIANVAFQKITLTNLVRDMKQSGATEQQIGMRVLQFQIAGQALSSYSLSDQVDALYGTGMSLGTMLNVMSIKRGKAFSMDEIKAITNRYNSHSGSLVTANGVVIKDKPQSSTVSESRGGKQSGGKGQTETTGKGAGKGSALPVPEPIKAKNGLNYESNPKHTPGGQGFRPNAGIEPVNSFELFGESVSVNLKDKIHKSRYTMDNKGNIHRFSPDNRGNYHWSGSTADKIKLNIPN
ncbi:hypothetical protein [Snodgrassella alvi]|uniref:hypothetical protein n=1 Tax=Snodgrassella alvi TaxID=1196083 RepID=UPI001C557DF6|nr:hypothetical protein [Snodgrassella alvi]